LVSPRHPQITQILRGIATGVEERDWHMQVFPLPASTIFGGQEPSLLATLLRERRMDAVIALSPHTPEDIQQLHALGIPVVSVDNEYPGTDTPCVMPDADSATEQLLDHLANELGHRRFGLVLGPQSRQSNRLIRFSTILGQSLRRQFKERDLYCPISNQLNCNYRWEAAESTIRQWLTAASRPTALIFIDQTMAEQAAALAKELGLRVPDDLSITGWGGPARSWLTQIIPSYEAMGREAVILLDQQRAARLPRVVRLPVSLDVGKSTGRAR
jgi:DNA-binding LacI/PurR family transcriptional regulator